MRQFFVALFALTWFTHPVFAKELPSRLLSLVVSSETTARIYAVYLKVDRSVAELPVVKVRKSPRGQSRTKGQQDVESVVLSEMKTRVYYAVHLAKDCSVAEIPVVKVRKSPRNGRLDIEEVQTFTNFGKETQLYECNKKQSAVNAVFYTSNPGAAGKDSFAIEVFYPLLGKSQEISFSVTIKH
jgi:hypothetical protein